jgi:hypothetical protein
MPRYQTSEEDKKAIAEWLAKGNKVTVCEANARSNTDEIGYSFYGNKKKKKPAKKD